MSIVAIVTLSDPITKIIQDLDLKVNLTSAQLIDLDRYSILRENIVDDSENSSRQVFHPPEAHEAIFYRSTQSLHVLHHGLAHRRYAIEVFKNPTKLDSIKRRKKTLW